MSRRNWLERAEYLAKRGRFWPNMRSTQPSGPAGGDLSGAYPNPTVSGVNNASVPINEPTVGTNSLGQLVPGSGGSAPNDVQVLATNAMISSSGSYSTLFTVNVTSGLNYRIEALLMNDNSFQYNVKFGGTCTASSLLFAAGGVSSGGSWGIAPRLSGLGAVQNLGTTSYTAVVWGGMICTGTGTLLLEVGSSNGAGGPMLAGSSIRVTAG